MAASIRQLSGKKLLRVKNVSPLGVTFVLGSNIGTNRYNLESFAAGIRYESFNQRLRDARSTQAFVDPRMVRNDLVFGCS